MEQTSMLEYRQEIKSWVFNPSKLPTVKCSLKNMTEVRENGFLIMKRMV